MSSRVAAGTESDTGIQTNIDGCVASGWFMPCRYNPETIGNANRLELCLGDSNPIGVFNDLVTDDLGLFNT